LSNGLHRRSSRGFRRGFRLLIEDWRDVLPTQSVCLSVPIVLPSEYNASVHLRQRQEMRRLIEHEDAMQEIAE